MNYIGRKYEWGLLEQEERKKSAGLIVLYGRRRVGKTCLIEEFYKNKNLWKFDGLEKQPKSKQIRAFLMSLAKITKNALYETARAQDWITIFNLLDQAIQSSKHKYNMTLFFDELPYMANKRAEMISDLKWAWDNLWSKHDDFTLVLCGSIASFMVDSVVQSSALYGRINLELCLEPLSLKECSAFFNDRYSKQEIIKLYMFCGGIPAYLEQIDTHISISQNINRLAFSKDGYFTKEFERIFKDVFQEEALYKKIMTLFSKHKSLKAHEITEYLGMSEGSGFIRYLDNLEKAGFIKSFVPCGKPLSSKLKRYYLYDEYVTFYFKFIAPHLLKIVERTHDDLFSKIVQSPSYKIWSGLAFERLCLKHIKNIISSLHIDQLVTEYGPYFDRHTNRKEATQIDLLLYRHDPVITVCEMKYYETKIGTWIIDEVEKKVQLLEESKKTIEKVLITTEGITKDLAERNYFSKVLGRDSLF